MSAIAAGLEICSWERANGRLTRVDRAALADEDLLELVARDRDADAFEELYRRYARAVLGLVRRVLRDAPVSEDVVQEAFTSVWRAAASYRRERGSAVGWLYAIARNAATDAARWRPGASGADLPEQPDPGPLPDEQVAADLEAFRVHAAVDALPAREREIIELAYFSGLSQSEIAGRLSLPLGTVKTRNRSALRRLATRLTDEEVVGVER